MTWCAPSSLPVTTKPATRLNATGQAGVVRLREHRVHALEHALDDAGRLAEPGRRGEHEDLGREQLLADGRPLVAFALVRGDPRQQVEIDRADHLAGGAALLEGVAENLRQRLGVRGRRRALERAIQDEGVDWHGSSYPGL